QPKWQGGIGSSFAALKLKGASHHLCLLPAHWSSPPMRRERRFFIIFLHDFGCRGDATPPPSFGTRIARPPAPAPRAIAARSGFAARGASPPAASDRWPAGRRGPPRVRGARGRGGETKCDGTRGHRP